MINILYVLIITFSFIHSMAFFDYNLPLFVTILYLWNNPSNKKEIKEGVKILFYLLSTLIIDSIYILYFSVSYQLKFSLKNYDMDSWTQQIGFYRYIRISFAFLIIFKMLVIILIVLYYPKISEKLTFTSLTKYFLEFFFLK
jgi:hypothetical protein